MSVEIYNVEETEQDAILCLAVSSENFFNSYWQKAIIELKITSLGNGVWLKRENINIILTDFNKIRIWAVNNLTKENAEYMRSHIDRILDRLPKEWNNQFPRLWMG